MTTPPELPEAAKSQGAKTEAQMMLERMREQCARYQRINQRLGDVLRSIRPIANSPIDAKPEPGAGLSPQRIQTLFDGLTMLAERNDKVAEQLEAGVGELERLF